MHRKYNHISGEERKDIAYYRSRYNSIREIARMLNRSHATIYREVNRNRNEHGNYVAADAQRAARCRTEHKPQYVRLRYLSSS